MTKESLRERIHQMFDDYIESELDRKIDKAINSGAIDIDGAEDNFLLPKIVLCAIVKDMGFQYKPYNKRDMKMVNNVYALI